MGCRPNGPSEQRHGTQLILRKKWEVCFVHICLKSKRTVSETMMVYVKSAIALIGLSRVGSLNVVATVRGGEASPVLDLKPLLAASEPQLNWNESVQQVQQGRNVPVFCLCSVLAGIFSPLQSQEEYFTPWGSSNAVFLNCTDDFTLDLGSQHTSEMLEPMNHGSQRREWEGKKKQRWKRWWKSRN